MKMVRVGCPETSVANNLRCPTYQKSDDLVPTLYENFMVAPYINNIKNFIVQLMQKKYKILRLLK